MIPQVARAAQSGESSAALSPTLPAATSQKAKTKARAQKRGGSGLAEKCGGSGSEQDLPSDCPLPALDGIQWEKRTDRPGYAAWHAPQGATAHRNTKTYLGYVGRRLLAEWAALLDDQRRAVVEQWVSERRAEKGISLR